MARLVTDRHFLIKNQCSARTLLIKTCVICALCSLKYILLLFMVHELRHNHYYISKNIQTKSYQLNLQINLGDVEEVASDLETFDRFCLLKLGKYWFPSAGVGGLKFFQSYKFIERTENDIIKWILLWRP